MLLRRIHLISWVKLSCIVRNRTIWKPPTVMNTLKTIYNFQIKNQTITVIYSVASRWFRFCDSSHFIWLVFRLEIILNELLLICTWCHDVPLVIWITFNCSLNLSFRWRILKIIDKKIFSGITWTVSIKRIIWIKVGIFQLNLLLFSSLLVGFIHFYFKSDRIFWIFIKVLNIINWKF